MNLKIGINGKEDEIVQEMKQYNLEYLGLTETKKKGKGMTELQN